MNVVDVFPDEEQAVVADAVEEAPATGRSPFWSFGSLLTAEH